MSEAGAGPEAARDHAPGWEAVQQSITERREIIAPPGFVSVYHEIRSKDAAHIADVLTAIDHEGLKPMTEYGESRNGQSRRIEEEARNDQRPEWVQDLGISRQSIYAYPSLELGNGLAWYSSASLRFEDRLHDAGTRDYIYQVNSEGRPDVMEEFGVSSRADFDAALNNPAFAKALFRGEVLELKVDPTACYVAEMDALNNAGSYARRYSADRDWDRMSEEDQAYYTDWGLREAAIDYWGTLIRLDDFRKNYELISPLDDEGELRAYYEQGYRVRPEAGALYSYTYVCPEIIIPQPVPPELIRVLP